MTAARRSILAVVCVAELALALYCWRVFLAFGLRFYVFLDCHVAGCALSGCPKIPFW